jgi:hypothetical protein
MGVDSTANKQLILMPIPPNGPMHQNQMDIRPRSPIPVPDSV